MKNTFVPLPARGEEPALQLEGVTFSYSGGESSALSDVTLTLDEDAFTGGSAFLFAEVLDVFFGLYAGINTFTQLVLKTCNRKGTWHRWPLRSGALPLI